jgi:hypothetical protein
MAPREMTLMYIPNNKFRASKIEGILSHFAILHMMMRRTLVARIGKSNTTLAYERNLLDALMKFEQFYVFDYIINEIWNIAINSQRSCGFAPYIMHMIEVVVDEKFYKDVAHEPLHPTVPKEPRSHPSAPPPVVAPTRITHSGGVSSASSSNSGFLKMFYGIFVMCRPTDQHMDVMEQHLEIVRRNQDSIHN